MDTSVDVDTLFRLFTVPLTDFVKTTLILDVRDQKSFKRGHVNQAYCVRLSTNGKVLADYSGAEYALPWSQDVWVGRDVFVYGSAGLKRDHCVLDFLSKAGCRSLRVYKEGYEAFKTAYPALCTPSIKANSYKQYPSQIISGLLYLGDWSHAEAIERLQEELGIQAVVTVHNHPENLKPKLPKGVRWLPWTLADVDTADISPCFHRTFEFIEDARNRKQAVLVHCGAGVSRSATLCMMYLMRRNHWNAEMAKKYCVQRRSVVCPNDGFWRTLCALESTLGITSRSDPDATTGFLGVDAPAAPAVLSADVVGGKVPVTLLTGGQAAAHDLKRKVESDGVSSGADDRSAKRNRGEAGAGATTGAGAAESNDLPPGHNGKGLVVTLEVSKPEGLVGQLVVGPMGPHQRVIFGRLPTADVVLEHQSLSRQHAALAVEGTAGLTLTDLQSGHGTKLGDVWIRPNTAKPLKVGSCFKLGASSRLYTVKSLRTV
ncbi:MAP kinase phosphatase 5 [Haematococcus lacustris]